MIRSQLPDAPKKGQKHNFSLKSLYMKIEMKNDWSWHKDSFGAKLDLDTNKFLFDYLINKFQRK